jgi:hypothetical protein
LTAAFGVSVLLGGTSTIPVLRDVHQAWPSITPALALWLLVAGGGLIAVGSSPEALGPGPATCAAARRARRSCW